MVWAQVRSSRAAHGAALCATGSPRVWSCRPSKVNRKTDPHEGKAIERLLGRIVPRFRPVLAASWIALTLIAIGGGPVAAELRGRQRPGRLQVLRTSRGISA